MTWRRAMLAALLVCASAWSAPQTWDVDQLMKMLAGQAGGQVRFTEHKFIAILDRPVVSTGEMQFIPPHRLLRRTETPVAETMVLDGDTIEIRREGRELQLRLHDYPEAVAFIDSIRALLAGNRGALERNFALFLSGDASEWTLNLLPNDTRLADLVHRIHIRGNGKQVRSIEILQADGDRSLMQFQPIEGKTP